MQSGSISVAVCTDREASTLPEVVAALRAQGVQPTVVREPSIAVARNRATADCTAPVLAFVDDDVIIEPGWLEALRAAWDVAGDDVGAIGGPIAGGRYALDYGADTADLDAAERTMRAGNLSFRTSALRGVQGFWPMRGRPGCRDWFCEEHDAQRQLAGVGWRLRYDPSLRARREGPAPSARERLRYGARLQLVGGGRPRGQAALAAARATVAAARSIPRRDGAATDAVRRAAENAGALGGARLVRAEVEPVAASTPLRHAVPLPSRAARGRGERAVILAYHRVADVAADDLALAVSPAHFAEQLDAVARVARAVPLDELVEAVSSGRASERMVAVTFDDAYADVIEHAEPALAARGVPATLFVPTELVAQRRTFWWDEVALLFDAAGDDTAPVLELSAAGERRAWAARTPEQRRATRALVHAWLQPLPAAAIAEALEQLRSWAGQPVSAPPSATPEQIAAFAAHAGLTTGAHSATHAALGTLDAAAQREEVLRSRDALAEWTGRPPTSFSYPFGVPGADFDAVTERIVADAGFAQAVAMVPGRLGRGADRFALPRHVVPDAGAEAFGDWLERLFAHGPA